MQPYSFGIGDRFAKQGPFLLRAFKEAERKGILITPVFNKSHREHKTVGSRPKSVMDEAQQAVQLLDWIYKYGVDADHIGLDTVHQYLNHANFFTIDVAKYIGTKASNEQIDGFVKKISKKLGDNISVPGMNKEISLREDEIIQTARRYLFAIHKAAEIHAVIARHKKGQRVYIEISMDEVVNPQSPLELLLILVMIAEEGIPIDTIAPKFCGRFNKGIDYEGDINQFAAEFENDLCIINYIDKTFGLDKKPKLSVHTGSDKFSLYPVMNKLIKKHDAGLHLKTAGTNWLAEAAGLALAADKHGDDKTLNLVKKIYKAAHKRFRELTGPYEHVLNIDEQRLPSPTEVDGWSGQQFADALMNDPDSESYNPSFRQLMHTAYKIAAEMGDRFLHLLKKYEQETGHYVFENIYQNHLKPLYIDE